MKVNGNNLKAGMIVSHKGGMWKVVATQSVKPGKGGAFAQVELKNLNKNTKNIIKYKENNHRNN